jgi:hypothetical protein
MSRPDSRNRDFVLGQEMPVTILTRRCPPHTATSSSTPGTTPGQLDPDQLRRLQALDALHVQRPPASRGGQPRES